MGEHRLCDPREGTQKSKEPARSRVGPGQVKFEPVEPEVNEGFGYCFRRLVRREL